MAETTYEHCLGCGQDVTPCQVPDRCRLLGWRHVATGFHFCADGGACGTPGHDEPGWERRQDGYGWVRTDA